MTGPHDWATKSGLPTTDQAIEYLIPLLGNAVTPWMVHLADPAPDGHLEARLVVDPDIAFAALRAWVGTPGIGADSAGPLVDSPDPGD